MERSVVSEIELVFERDGQRAQGFIRIGQPFVVDDLEARCEVEASAPGVLRLHQTFSGNDTLQALLLAVRFLATMLAHHRGKGLRLLDLDGEEWPFDAYFGPFAAEVPTARER